MNIQKHFIQIFKVDFWLGQRCSWWWLSWQWTHSTTSIRNHHHLLFSIFLLLLNGWYPLASLAILKDWKAKHANFAMLHDFYISMRIKTTLRNAQHLPMCLCKQCIIGSIFANNYITLHFMGLFRWMALIVRSFHILVLLEWIANFVEIPQKKANKMWVCTQLNPFAANEVVVRKKSKSKWCNANECVFSRRCLTWLFNK